MLVPKNDGTIIMCVDSRVVKKDNNQVYVMPWKLGTWDRKGCKFLNYISKYLGDLVNII